MTRSARVRLWILAAVVPLQIGGCSLIEQQPDRLPVPNLEPAVVTVERGTIRSVVTLDAVALAAPTLMLTASGAGELKVIATAGESLVSGETIATIEGVENTIEIAAPRAGVVVSFHGEDGAVVAEGNPVAEFAPDAFRFVAQVSPEVLYRLYEPPVEIVAKVDHGPAPFPCEFASLGTPPGAEGNPLDLPVELACLVPDGVRVFSGVRATLGVTTGISENTLVVPLSAVLGEADRGVVTRVATDGGHESVEVELGQADGRRVEILD
nr:hypothetical protein [Chloroflexota bacterium]